MIILILYVGSFWFSLNTIGAILHAPHLHSFPVFRTNKYHFIGIPSNDLLKHQYIQQLLKINEKFTPKKIPNLPSYPQVNDTSKMQLVLPQSTNNFYARGKRQEMRRFPAYPTSYYFPHYMKAPIRTPHIFPDSGSAPYIFNMNPVVKENPILQKNNIGNQRPLLKFNAPSQIKTSPVPIITNRYPSKLDPHLERNVNLSLSETEYISPFLCRNNSGPNFRRLENSLSFKPMGNINLIETKNNFENILYENNADGWTPKIHSYSTVYPILEYKSHISEHKPLILENKPILEYKVPIPKYNLRDPYNLTKEENVFMNNTNKSGNQIHQIIQNKENNLNQSSVQNSDLNEKHFTNLVMKNENVDQNEEADKPIKYNKNINNKINKLIHSTELITSNKNFDVQNLNDKDIISNNYFSPSRNKNILTTQVILPTINRSNDSTEFKLIDEYKSRDEKRKRTSRFNNESSRNHIQHSTPEPIYKNFFEDFFDYDTEFKPMPTVVPTEPVFLPTILPNFTYLPNTTNSNKYVLKMTETTESPKFMETTTKEAETKSFRFRPQKSKEFIFKSMNRSIELQSEKMKNIVKKSNESNAKREILSEKPCIGLVCNKNITQVEKKYKRVHFKKFWKNNSNNIINIKNTESNKSLIPSNNVTVKIDRTIIKLQNKPVTEQITDLLNVETTTTTTTTFRPFGRHKIKLNIRNESKNANSSHTYKMRRFKDYSGRGNINYQNKNLSPETDIKNKSEASDIKRSRKHQRRKIETSTISSTLESSNFSFIENRQLNEDNMMPIETLFNFNLNDSTVSRPTTTTTTSTEIPPTTRRHIRQFESSTTESAIMKIAKGNSGGRRSNRRNRKHQKSPNIQDKNNTIVINKEVKNDVLLRNPINYSKLTTNPPVLPIEIYFKN